MSQGLGKMLLIAAVLLVGFVAVNMLLGGWFGLLVGAAAGLWAGMHFTNKIFDGGFGADNLRGSLVPLAAIGLISLLLGAVVGMKFFLGILVGELIGAGWSAFKHIKK